MFSLPATCVLVQARTSAWALALAVCVASAVRAEEAWVRVRPADTGEALENPGMGWVFHHYDNGLGGYGAPLGPRYDGSGFPGLTVCYLRLAWSHLEPEEGAYKWDVLDEPIRRYGAAGKRFALRLTVFEGRPDQGTPEWVRKAGANGATVKTYGVTSWEPDYDDPVFLAKLEAFLMAAGLRYGGNPSLAFVDVGTLGIWGEGHPIARRYGLDTLRRHIGLHRRAFKRALLVANDDWNRWFSDLAHPAPTPLDVARGLGLAFRDDSICVYANPQQEGSACLALPFVPDTPVILEMGHYEYAKKVKAWDGGRRYLQALKAYRGSYVSVHANPVIFLKENQEAVRQMNLILGYRLTLEEAAWPAAVTRAEGLAVEARWRNAGVAPCLPGGFAAWSLLDERCDVSAVLTDVGVNLRTLAPASEPQPALPPRTQRFHLPPELKAGVYTLAVSVGDTSGVPQLALPLASQLGPQRRYALGKLTIR